MNTLPINLGPPQTKIELQSVRGHDRNNYLKAVVYHYEAGQERGIPNHFFVHFDDRLMGSAELARRDLEAVVLPWIKSRQRHNGENNGRGYSPHVNFSVWGKLSARLHEGFGWPVVGE